MCIFDNHYLDEINATLTTHTGTATLNDVLPSQRSHDGLEIGYTSRDSLVNNYVTHNPMVFIVIIISIFCMILINYMLPNK